MSKDELNVRIASLELSNQTMLKRIDELATKEQYWKKKYYCKLNECEMLERNLRGKIEI